MKYQYFAVVYSAAAAVSFSAPSPAHSTPASHYAAAEAAPAWRLPATGWTQRFKSTQSAARKWEIGYLTLSAIDTIETIDCLRRDICTEANPLFGKHPKASKLIVAKIAFGAVHFAVFNHANARNPKTALRFAQISAGVQGSVVLLNARFAFK